MGIVRWTPPQEVSEQEELFLGRMKQTGKLFAFLRRHRHELLDASFQEELEGMYRDTGAGKAPVSPALMAMATLLQGYLKASDATMVELTVFDLRVQMVLDCVGSTEPAFSQGTLSEFRQRLIRTQMDRRLLERTAQVAMGQREFDWCQLNASLKVAIDSRPLEEHIATALEQELILACAVTAANRPEQEAMPELRQDLERQGVQPDELHIDRGYIASPVVNEVLDQGGEVVCKPWAPKNGELFAKSAFKTDMRSRQLTCPAGQTMPFTLGAVVEFDAKQCDTCPLRAQCTTAAPGQGRTVSIAEDEVLQHRLRKRVKSPSGRERLRERVGVEHRLAHLARRQGPRARYRGVRKNTFDLRRAASIQNIESWQRRLVRPSLKAG
jgi:hypothetical protein